MRAKFTKKVQDNDLYGVRLSLADEMLIDPRSNGFKEMLAYAEKYLPDLYETDNGAEYPQGESDWTKDLLYNLKYDLSKNFSREKLTLYVKMAQFVLKDKAESLEQEEKGKIRATPEQETSRHGSTQYKNVYAGVAIAGVAVAVTGICISKITVTTLGLAGVVIGGVLYFKNNRK